MKMLVTPGVLAALFACSMVAAQTPDIEREWRYQRFLKIQDAGAELVQKMGDVRSRPQLYVNWQQLDGDGRVDAILIAKTSNSSCVLDHVRCSGAVLLSSAEGYVTKVEFVPSNKSLYVRRANDGVRIYLPEPAPGAAATYTEVQLPTRVDGQATAARRGLTERQAQSDSATAFGEQDFTPLNRQLEGIERLRTTGDARLLPMGAPVLHRGASASLDRDLKMAALALDRIAAGRLLPSSPSIEFEDCNRWGWAEIMSRAIPADQPAATTVICVKDATGDAAKNVLAARVLMASAHVANWYSSKNPWPDSVPKVYRPYLIAYTDLIELAGMQLADLKRMDTALGALARSASDGLQAERDQFETHAQFRAHSVSCMVGVVGSSAAQAALTETDIRFYVNSKAQCDAAIQRARQSR